MALCDHDIDTLTVLATEDGHLLVLEDDETLLLLDETEVRDSNCAGEVWAEEEID